MTVGIMRVLDIDIIVVPRVRSSYQVEKDMLKAGLRPENLCWSLSDGEKLRFFVIGRKCYYCS